MLLRPQTVVGIFVTAMIVVFEMGVSFNSALLPFVRADFHTTEQVVQLSVGLGLLALGCSGMAYGGLSERFGRRPLILIGLCVFFLSTLASAMANSVATLIAARFCQGLGAGVGWIVGNACFKDLFHGKKYSQVMNQVHAVAGIVPAVAPILASSLVLHIGWRHCLWIVCGAAGLVAMCNFAFLPETNQRPRPVSFQSIVRTYISLLTRVAYVRYLVVKVLTVMLIFCDVANIPLIFMEHMGVASNVYGFYVAGVFAAYVAGSVASGYLCHVMSVDKLLSAGLLLIAGSNGAILLANTMTPLNAVAIQAFKAFTYLGLGLIFGNATACIVSAAEESPGSGSALMIALEMIFSALGIYVLGFFFNGTVVPLCAFMLLTAVFCIGSFWLSRPREPAAV